MLAYNSRSISFALELVNKWMHKFNLIPLGGDSESHDEE